MLREMSTSRRTRQVSSIGPFLLLILPECGRWKIKRRGVGGCRIGVGAKEILLNLFFDPVYLLLN